MVLHVESQDGIRDLIFWLDPRFPRLECLDSRGVAELPDRWSDVQGACISSVDQPDSDRRMTLSLEGKQGSWVIEYYGFARPSLVLRKSTGEQVLDMGAAPPASAGVTKPFVLDLLEHETSPVPEPEDLKRAVRGVDDLWLEAARSLSSTAQDVWTFIRSELGALSSRPVQGYLVMANHSPVGVSLHDFSSQLPHRQFQACDSLSEASSRFVSVARRRLDERESRTAALATAREMRSRLKRTLAQLRKDHALQHQHATWQENADWLTAQLGQIQKGQTTFEVTGSEGPREVTLDPRLKPHEQAQRWYHKARRLRRGLETTGSRVSDAEQKVDRLDALIAATEEHLDSSDAKVSEAFAQLKALVARAPTRQRIRVQEKSARFRRFRSPGGLAIWVGRNNQENDELTLHAAHKDDLWFHAQQTPGSHVLLRSHALAQSPPHQDVLAAAGTAAYYSKARTSQKVPVIYTLAKYVRKPRKAAAGKVVVEREKSIMVEPALPPLWNEADET
jgi:predicted ribosome quality control (RQC) complex YloA/Tae2 family protein